MKFITWISRNVDITLYFVVCFITVLVAGAARGSHLRYTPGIREKSIFCVILEISSRSVQLF